MPIRLDTWPEQKYRGSSIPGYRYTSKDFFEKEWEGMWTKSWLLLGREAEMPEPGNWQMEPVGREEILMVRQKDGSVEFAPEVHGRTHGGLTPFEYDERST